MKIPKQKHLFLIENTETKLFMVNSLEWTADKQKAKKFSKYDGKQTIRIISVESDLTPLKLTPYIK